MNYQNKQGSNLKQNQKEAKLSKLNDYKTEKKIKIKM